MTPSEAIAFMQRTGKPVRAIAIGDYKQAGAALTQFFRLYQDDKVLCLNPINDCVADIVCADTLEWLERMYPVDQFKFAEYNFRPLNPDGSECPKENKKSC